MKPCHSYKGSYCLSFKLLFVHFWYDTTNGQRIMILTTTSSSQNLNLLRKFNKNQVDQKSQFERARNQKNALIIRKYISVTFCFCKILRKCTGTVGTGILLSKISRRLLFLNFQLISRIIIGIAKKRLHTIIQYKSKQKILYILY